jgi:hypothetical protein
MRLSRDLNAQIDGPFVESELQIAVFRNDPEVMAEYLSGLLQKLVTPGNRTGGF